MRWFLVLALIGCQPAGTSRSNTSASSTVPTTVPEAALAEPPPARDVPCAEALAEVVKISPAGEPGKQSMGEIFVAHCTADSWSAEVRRCFTQQPGMKPQPCVEMLSNYQRQQLGEDLASQLPQ
jgi:hypothetical protein